MKASIYFRHAAITGVSVIDLIRFRLYNEMSRIVRKPDFCLCENKGADQLADQRLCFCYTDSIFSSPEPLGSQGELIGWP